MSCTVLAAMPCAEHRASRSVPCGVPNSCSKRSAPTTAACERKEKIPPPSLSTTTTRRSIFRFLRAVSELASWRKATSPISRTVGPAASATPIAEARTPSMPLAPRLAYTLARRSIGAYHSTSRIGMDDESTRLSGPPFSTIDLQTVCATAGSVSTPIPRIEVSIASRAIISLRRHRVAQVVPDAPRRRSANHRHTDPTGAVIH